MNDTILLVDDDVRVVSALQRSLYRQYRIEIAAGAEDALEAVGQNSYAVVVSDLRMPGMNGVELLTHVKRLSPDTVRVLLTGQADLDSAIAAVNEGNVFRFLTKPCPYPLLCKALDSALDQHRLQAAEQDVLKETLMGTVAILSEVLSAFQEFAFGRASRTRETVRLLAAELGLGGCWEFEAAAMLSQLGCIAVDPRILKMHYAGEELTEADRVQLLAQASIGKQLLHKVPRLQAVAQMIERQYQNWQSAYNSDPQAHLIAIGAQMLHVALEFERLTGTGKSSADTLIAMKRCEGEYHPDVLAGLERLHQAGRIPSASDDRFHPTVQDMTFGPIAEEVLRSIRG
jgi:response regulator RpfG family c-di-GMP phosphodiesterase